MTVNTLIFEDEIEELVIYTDYLVKHHVDALIVQDLGLIEYFVNRYPDTEIHASTQMNTYNKNQLSHLKSLGVSRVILARETSIDQIKEMKEAIDIDLEVFVHGALCVSYSGNCLFSSMNGGRSGNRGECAQPCRLAYRLFRNNTLIEPESYLLSTKDLMTIDHLKEIADSGVKSLKIEGRMRRPEYVVATVRAYREALDKIFDESLEFDLEKRIRELLVSYNRDFTKGYLLNELPSDINMPFRPNHLGITVGKVLKYERGKTTVLLSDALSVGDGIRIPGTKDIGGEVGRILKNDMQVETASAGDVIVIDLATPVSPGSIVMKTLDKALDNSLASYFSETYKMIDLDGTLTVKVGEPIELTIQTSFSDRISIRSEYIVEKARNIKQTAEMIYAQFDKFGNTFYRLGAFDIDTDGEGFIPNLIFNELRREAIDIIENQVKNTAAPRIEKSSQTRIDIQEPTDFDIYVKVETVEQLSASKRAGINHLTVSENMHLNPEEINESGYFLETNRIWMDTEKYRKYKRLLIRDTGLLELAKNHEIIIDTTLNVTNSLSLASLLKHPVSSVALSFESSFENTKKMITNFKKQYGFIPNVQLVVYGKIDLMLTKYCPITKFEGVYRENCNLCQKNDYALVDSSDREYVLKRDGFCNLRVLHALPLNLVSFIKEIKQTGISSVRLNFTDESEEETYRIIKTFQNALKGSFIMNPDSQSTLGRFIR